MQRRRGKQKRLPEGPETEGTELRRQEDMPCEIASGDVSIQSVQHGTHGCNAWHNCKRLTVEHC